MENKEQVTTAEGHSAEFLKKRKFLLAIPILIIPFLTMTFWALGGGKMHAKENAILKKGLDTTLPMAEFSDKKEKDKMDIYQAAGKDTSANKAGTQKNFMQAMGFGANAKMPSDSNVSGTLKTPGQSEDQTAKIEAKLAEINKQLHAGTVTNVPGESHEPEDADAIRNIRKVKKMMRSASSTRQDPEMQQLSLMLQQVQEIQNPGSISARLKKQVVNYKPFKALPAIIDGKQKVLDGGEVKLKLTDSARLNGYFLPKGQVLYGSCQVTNQRLLLNIKNIRQNNSIIPVDLTVFGLDGLPGIPAHEAELAGAAGGGADNALASMQFMTMDQSLGAQAAAGGIQAAKGLFSKKVKRIKVKLKNGYNLLLRNNQLKGN